MLKKASVLKSLDSMSILIDRITDEKSYGDTMPFIKFMLDSRLRNKVSALPFSDDLLKLIDCAIAYSDDMAAFCYAFDDLYNAVSCL